MSIACYVVGGVRYERLSSGFVIKKEQLEDAYKYYLVTNASKLFYRGISDGVLTYSKTPEYVEVVFGDYRRYYAQVEGYNEKLDVLVLSIITKDEIPVFELGDSDDLLLGDTVYAMGTPEIGVALLNSVNKGFISKLNVESTIGFNNEVITTYNSHQFDAPTNLGMEVDQYLHKQVKLLVY
jgi:S1-C subfamily serine protease